MSDFLSIRNYVHFRRYSDAVKPYFWPVLYWQLKRALLCLQRERLSEVLLADSWWGGVRIVHRGDRIHTPVHNRLALTKPRWDNPVWSTDVPAAFLEPLFIFVCALRSGRRVAAPCPVFDST